MGANSQNLPPIANDDSYSVGSNITNTITTTNGLSINDSDPEGTSLRVDPTPVTGPSNGLVMLNTNGSFTYTPTAGYAGSDSFDYRVCDGGIDNLVSQFNFDTPTLTDATVGPNASSINPDAEQLGCGIIIPADDSGGATGLDIIVPNTGNIFEYRSFRIAFRYNDNEGTAEIISGGNFRIYHIGSNNLGVRVNVVSSVTGTTVALTVDLGSFGSGENDYIVEYDEVTGDIIYTRNGIVNTIALAPDNSPLDTTLVTNITIGQFMDGGSSPDPSLCDISIIDTSKLCDIATVNLDVRATIITNRNITYRVNRN